VDRKGSFNPNAAGNLANGKRFPIRLSLPPENETLKNLDALFFTLADLHMHFHRIPGLERRYIHPQKILFNLLYLVHDSYFSFSKLFICAPGRPSLCTKKQLLLQHL